MTNTYHQLALQNQNYLHALAYKLTSDSNLADDLFQDTMLKIFSKETQFDVGTNFKAWSQTIMRNTFINHYRAKIRRQTDPCDTTDVKFVNVYGSTIHNEGDSELTLEFLNHVIDQLDQHYKKVFWLHYQGYKYEEIANTLDMTVSKVRNMVFVAKKMLQYKLKNVRDKI